MGHDLREGNYYPTETQTVVDFSLATANLGAESVLLQKERKRREGQQWNPFECRRHFLATLLAARLSSGEKIHAPEKVVNSREFESLFSVVD